MMWNRCEIYQFSRKLLEPKWSKRHECYVSTGFDREIGGENQEVPPEIANAVHNHACRINDSYPPQTIALISREIGKYALLAVATALRDDSDRPLIGYRYFWLEKPSQDGEIDGIGTLLEWWMTQGSPTFQLQPSSSSPKTPPKASSSWLNRHDFLKKYSTDSVKISIKKIEQEKKYSRSPLYLDNITFEDCREFHALALSLQANDSSPLNWAFRVSQLEIPEQFSLVYTQDSEREQLRLFGLCYAMDWGYRGWNPYVEKHLAIFVNCFCLKRTHQLSLLPDKDLVNLCPPIEPYQVTKSHN